MADDFDGPTLAGAIAQVRRELAEALAEGEGQAVRFGMAGVELEFLVEARKVAGGDAGVRFHVVSLGGKAEFQRTETNRVKVSLQPVGRDGRPLKVSSEVERRPDARRGDAQPPGTHGEGTNMAAQGSRRPDGRP
ncbi:trypco2 family protein [Streptomyces sp. B21-101]|uniref:trypco2 family protein n=1 Tax=Streptomyces sp. B21-101 TaxID=3039415 RepID=UPI002FF107FF